MGVKVLLSGAGGDDIFTGYRRHFALQQEKYWSWLPYPTRKVVSILSNRLPNRSPTLRRIKKALMHAHLNFVERLWRSVKYEEVYLKAYNSVAEARSGIGDYLKFYNTERKHQEIAKTPDQAYFGEIMWQEVA